MGDGTTVGDVPLVSLFHPSGGDIGWWDSRRSYPDRTLWTTTPSSRQFVSPQDSVSTWTPSRRERVFRVPGSGFVPRPDTKLGTLSFILTTGGVPGPVTWVGWFPRFKDTEPSSKTRPDGPQTGCNPTDDSDCEGCRSEIRR